MKSTSDISTEEKELNMREMIIKDYFDPMIFAFLKNPDLDTVLLIKEIITLLQFHYVWQSLPGGREQGALNIIFNFEEAILPSFFKKHLLSHPEIKECFIGLGFLYLEAGFQAQLLPGVAVADIHTCIRGLFHDSIDPLHAFKIKHHPKMPAITFCEEEIEDNGLLFQASRDIQRKIYSYLDVMSLFSLTRTCQTGYALYIKSGININSHGFYMVAGDVKITRPKEENESSKRIVFRKAIFEDEFADSFLNKDLKEVKIFRSLYEAVEYCQYLQHNVKAKSGEDEGFIPSLWKALYLGNPEKLNFKKESMTITNSLSQFDKQRLFSMYAATVPKASMHPISCTLILSKGRFATYTNCQVFNFEKHMAVQQKQLRDKRCVLM